MKLEKENSIKYKNQIYKRNSDALKELNNNIVKILDILEDFNAKLSLIYKLKLKSCIDNYLHNIEGDINLEVQQTLLGNIEKQLSDFKSSIFNLCEKINNLKELNEKLEIIFSKIVPLEFLDRTKINNINIKLKLLNSFEEYSYDNKEDLNFDNSYFNFMVDDCIENKKSNSFKENDILKCSICEKKEDLYFCKQCNVIFCDKCKIKQNENKKVRNHQTQNLDNNLSNYEKGKILFLNSLKIMINFILIIYNIFLNYKEVNYANKKEINDFPYIKEIKKYDNLIDFLKAIKNIISDIHKENFDIHLFDISDLNSLIKNKFDEFFIEDKKKLEIFDIIYDNFSLNDDSLEEFINSEFKEIKNEFFYFIYIIPKRNINFNQNDIKRVFKQRINDIFQTDLNNIIISFTSKNNFINKYIKSRDFSFSSLEDIKSNYPCFDKLYEYKIIFDFINNHDNFKNIIDYRGNLIFQDSRTEIMRGKELYYPPYGWFGIGLKVIGNYDNGNDEWLDKNSNKWAIAYYSFGENISSYNKFIEKLSNIITKKELILGNNKFNISSQLDKRHPSKNIGEGLYLTPDINNAEKNSGKILINKKEYKVVLMARVSINNIREPYNNKNKCWVLNKEFIRFYRIILKKAS